VFANLVAAHLLFLLNSHVLFPVSEELPNLYQSESEDEGDLHDRQQYKEPAHDAKRMIGLFAGAHATTNSFSFFVFVRLDGQRNSTSKAHQNAWIFARRVPN
jgi:hypothetical protein